MTRLYTGDYSTGDFSQWSRCANIIRSANKGYFPSSGYYPASIVSDDPDCGYCARYELRSGDVIGGDSGGRTEMFGDDASYVAEGQTAWYAMSFKFDSAFPNNRNELGWGVITQWKPASLGPYNDSWGPSVLGWGWSTVDAPGYANGYYYLVWVPQSSPNVITVPYARPIMKLPLSPGAWQDIKMRIYFKKDNTGTIQVWRNGVLQTFDSTYGGGGTTFTGQTMCGGSGPTGSANHQGIYRDSAATHTDIVYMKGFRIADSESSL